MNASALSPGIYRVQIPNSGRGPFMLSVVEVYGLKGVAGYEEDKPRPRKGKHLTLSQDVRQWVESMERL